MVQQRPDGTVEFAFFRPAASLVELAGDFNRWQPADAPMAMDDAGWWRTRLRLEPGEYRFRYRVDQDDWEADFAAFGVDVDRHGLWTSRVAVLEVPASQTRPDLAVAG